MGIVRFMQIRHHTRGRFIPRFHLPEEQRISYKQGKARQNHLGGGVALTEGSMVGRREIHAAAKQGQWKGHG